MSWPVPSSLLGARRRCPGRSRPTTAVVAGLPVDAAAVGRSRPTTTAVVAGLPVGAPSTVGRSRPTTVAVVLVVLAVCSLVVSCSGGAGTQATATARGTDPGTAAVGGTASPTPTPTASALPSLSAEHQALRDAALATEEPVRPEGMDENTPDGLAIATKYFLDLYPYVFATGDLTAWEEISEDDCIFCNSVIDNATAMHTSGGWADPWEQQVTLVSYGSDPADPDRYVVTASIISPARKEYTGSPLSAVDLPTRDSTFLIQIRWNDGRWLVEEGERL